MPARHRVQGGMVARSRCRLLIFIALGAFPCAAGTAHLEHVVRRPGAHSAALDAPPPPHALDEAYAHRTAPVHRLKAGSPWWRKTRSIGAPQGTATKYILLGTGALEAVDRLSRSLFLLRAPIRGWIVAPEACAGGSGSAQNWKVQSVSGARAVYSDGRAHNLMALESVALPEMQCTGPGLLLVGQCGSDAVSLSPAVVDALEDRLSDDTTSVVAALNPEILEHAARRIDWATCRICHIGGGSPVETKLAAAAASEGGLELGPLAIESWDSVESAVQSLEEELGIIKSQLEVAEAARRALQEEVQQLNDERDQAVDKIARYVAYIGELPSARAGAAAGTLPADRNLSATVISVRRSEGSTLAEINAGSRDGVQEGWVLTVADGSKFIGNLRIIEVDVNRSTGVIELEDANNRGSVRSGQRAIARKGQ